MKIVIFIIIIVISILKAVNQNKKKERVRKPVKQKPVNEIWQEYLDEKKVVRKNSNDDVHLGEDIEEKVIPEEVEAKKTTEVQYQFDPSKEGTSDIPEVYKLLKVQPKREKIKIDGEPFSVRKAVIYSEILNRKYV